MVKSARSKIDKKIVDGLEKIADIMKHATWQISDPLKLSPIQVRILTYLLDNKEIDVKISSLAEEFLVSRPTITDSIKSLAKRDFIQTIKDPLDKRSSFISLSPMGIIVAENVSEYSQSLSNIIKDLESSQKESFFGTLMNILFSLQLKGFIPLQKMCFSCKYYSQQDEQHYCSLLEQKLNVEELRINCPEHSKSNHY
jgi:DNA-binding MarR family transcriptional regulator